MSAPKIPPEGVEVSAWMEDYDNMGWVAIQNPDPRNIKHECVPAVLISADGGDWVRREEYDMRVEEMKAAKKIMWDTGHENERLVLENERLRDEINNILASMAGGWVDEVLARLAAPADSKEDSDA